MTETLRPTTTEAGVEPGEPARPRERDRLLGLTGIGFALILVPVVAIPHASLDFEPTKPPRDAAVIVDFFRAHYALEQYQALMHSLAAVVLLVFGVALARLVRSHQREGSPASLLVLAGATGAAAVMVLTMALVAGSITMTGGIDGHTQGWLYALGWYEHFKMLYFLPLLLGPSAVVLGRTRALPRALTWSAQAIAGLALVAMVAGLSASTEFLMFPVFMVFLVWMLATGVVALTRGVGRAG